MTNPTKVNWMIGVVLYFCTWYLAVATVIYYSCLHNERKQELIASLGPLNTRDRARRLRLWEFCHFARCVFLLVIIIDMTFELGGASIDSKTNTFANKPHGIWFTLDCITNNKQRFATFAISNLCFSLFSWCKVRLVLRKQLFGKFKYFIEFLKYYMFLVYPITIIIAFLTIHSSHAKELCIFTFDRWEIDLYALHDICLLILLLALFVIPMYLESNRQLRHDYLHQHPIRRIHTHHHHHGYNNYDGRNTQSRSYHKITNTYTAGRTHTNTSNSNSNSTINSKNNNSNTNTHSMSNSNSMSNDNSNNNNNSNSNSRINTVNTSDNNNTSQRLRQTIIRNTVSGALAIVIAIVFLFIFIYAGNKAWDDGYLLTANFVRMVLEYLCLTFTYNYWLSMLFPMRTLLKPKQEQMFVNRGGTQ